MPSLPPPGDLIGFLGSLFIYVFPCFPAGRRIFHVSFFLKSVHLRQPRCISIEHKEARSAKLWFSRRNVGGFRWMITI